MRGGWFVMAGFVAIYILSVYFIVFLRYSAESAREFEEYRLTLAADYACAAALQVTLNAENLSIDYTDPSSIVLSPSSALDVYKSVLCLNYDIVPSAENLVDLDRYIPVAVLACVDGFYITQLNEVDDVSADNITGGSYTLGWGMKHVYSYSPNPDVTYALTLQGAYSRYARRTGVGMSATVAMGRVTGNPVGLSNDAALHYINSSISTAISHQIARRNAITDNFWANSFFLPSQLSSYGVRPVTKPTLLVLLQNADLGGGSALSYVGVSGVTVQKRLQVVAFVSGGNRYYCYESQLDAADFSKIQAFYSSLEAACADGYLPSYEHLGRGIVF